MIKLSTIAIILLLVLATITCTTKDILLYVYTQIYDTSLITSTSRITTQAPINVNINPSSPAGHNNCSNNDLPEASISSFQTRGLNLSNL